MSLHTGKCSILLPRQRCQLLLLGVWVASKGNPADPCQWKVTQLKSKRLVCERLLRDGAAVCRKAFHVAELGVLWLLLGV